MGISSTTTKGPVKVRAYVAPNEIRAGSRVGHPARRKNEERRERSFIEFAAAAQLTRRVEARNK